MKPRTDRIDSKSSAENTVSCLNYFVKQLNTHTHTHIA